MMVCGQLFGAAALAEGPLALVDPLMASNLLFALIILAVRYRRRLGPRDYLGVLALLGGLATFAAAGDPGHGTSRQVPWGDWLVVAGSVLGVAAVLVLTGRRRAAREQAALLAGGAGVLFGLQDALTKQVTDELGRGIGTPFTSWPVYSLVIVAAVALLIAQSAFEAAPLTASLPAITSGEPITAIAIGAGVYGEHLNQQPALLVLEVVGIALMISSFARDPPRRAPRRRGRRGPARRHRRDAAP